MRGSSCSDHRPCSWPSCCCCCFLTARCYLALLAPSITSMLPPPASCYRLARTEHFRAENTCVARTGLMPSQAWLWCSTLAAAALHSTIMSGGCFALALGELHLGADAVRDAVNTLPLASCCMASAHCSWLDVYLLQCPYTTQQSPMDRRRMLYAGNKTPYESGLAAKPQSKHCPEAQLTTQNHASKGSENGAHIFEGMEARSIA